MKETVPTEKKEYASMAKKAFLQHIQERAEKYKFLKKICFLYCGILFLIFALCSLKVLFPKIIAPLLTNNMGNISLACFIAIQISFELDEEKTVRRTLLYCKAFFYIFNLCILANSKVPTPVTFSICLFSSAQIAYMYRSLSLEQAKLKTATEVAEKEGKKRPADETYVSVIIIAINAIALALGLARGLKAIELDNDIVLSFVLGTLVMYYVHTIIKAKTAQLIDDPAEIRDASVLELAFKIIQPLGRSLLGHHKKFKFS
jgi:hypothetical protein